MREYDLIIIGNGAAAFSATIKASELTSSQAKIAMVGIGPIGGTCVNVGCVPSKYFLEASHSVYTPLHPSIKGIGASNVKFDFDNLMQGLRQFVNNSRIDKYEKVIENYKNVDVYKGKGKFKSNNIIEVVNGNDITQLYGYNIIIATGSTPSIPSIPGIENVKYLTSNTVWDIYKLPRRITIIGAGAIALEIGQAFLHFGSEVSIIARHGIHLNTEPEIIEAIKQKLEKEGIKFYFNANILNLSEKEGMKKVQIDTPNGIDTIESDELLIATNRSPNTDFLQLENAGIDKNKYGYILVDSTMKSSAENVYAAGDCTSKHLYLETLAAREGVIAAMNIFGVEEHIDYNSAVWAVFTKPQIAGVGYTEKEYNEKKGACLTRTFSLKNLTKASIVDETDGLIKIIADQNTHKIVGMHIMSPSATDIITEGAYAVKYGFTYEDIISTSHIFPSFSEGIKLAAQSFVRDISKMSCCVE
ncbi:MAG: mercury(II) reductase [Thermoplasmata archaeon]